MAARDSAFKHQVYQANMPLTATADVLSAAFNAQTRWVRICNDAPQASTSLVHFLIGDGTPAIGTGTAYANLPPAWVEFVAVNPGQKLVARTGAGTTTLTVTELA